MTNVCNCENNMQKKSLFITMFLILSLIVSAQES